MAPPPQSPSNPRKRRASQSTGTAQVTSPTSPLGGEASTSAVATPSGEEAGKKKGRTNTPWTPAEEQRLKTMRDAGLSWGEIAKVLLLLISSKDITDRDMPVFPIKDGRKREKALVQGRTFCYHIVLA